MRILAIDTSCDETAAAVTDDTRILANVIWSQAKSHAEYGGVMPSLAQQMHKERLDFVIQRALTLSRQSFETIDAIAVTVGPGLAIALEVGINKAKELALKRQKKIIAVNHLEGHLLSSFAQPKTSKVQFPTSNFQFPSFGLVISGGNTIFVKIKKIGDYETLAQTTDDALGEALDKAARMLGLGYPGGAVLEKFARLGDPQAYTLPIPISGQEKRKIFTYSGLKTAFYRLVEKEKPLTKEKIYNLAACFQNTAFEHLIRVIRHILAHHQPLTTDHRSLTTGHFLVGGGVAANIEVRKRLRKLCKEFNIKLLTPHSQRFYGDNAAMIGVAAFLNPKYISLSQIDRLPDLKLG